MSSCALETSADVEVCAVFVKNRFHHVEKHHSRMWVHPGPSLKEANI